MTADVTVTPADDDRAATPRGRVARWLAIALGPLWVTTFRDPAKEGRLRLDALSRVERQLARAGLVMLFLLLGFVLFADVWRGGQLFQLLGQNELRFVPLGALPVTALGLLLAWALLAWGALDAAPSVRVVVAGLMVVCLAHIDVFGGIELEGTWALEHGGTLLRAGYVASPAMLVASALAHPLLRRRPRLSILVTATLRSGVLAGLALVFGVLVWMHHDAVQEGFPANVPTMVDGSMEMVGAFLIPLVYVAAVAVIDFALDVSVSLATPARRLAALWVKLILLGLIAYKVLTGLVLEWDFWRAQLVHQPKALLSTVVAIALLALLAAVVTRFPRSDDYALAKERLMYGGSLVLSLSYVLSVVGAGAALVLTSRFDSDVGTRVNDAIPYDVLSDEGLLGISVVVLGIGVWLMRRSHGGFGDELGSALVVVAAWFTWVQVNAVLRLETGFTYPAVDALVTLGVLTFLGARWRRIDTGLAATLLAVVLFGWLTMSRGDYISFVGGLLGLPAVLVVVVGVLLTLANGSSFSREGSKRLPADARPMLFVGYLLLSVVILFWVTVIHGDGQELDSLAGFHYLGIPMAAWLLGRRLLTRGDEAGGQAAAVLR